VTFVATDNYGAGVIAARKLAELVNGKGKVAELMHKPGGMSTGDRERAFEATMGRNFRRSRLWIAAMAWRIGPNRVTRPRTY
jgi:ribose transport system substrate-binding protein